MNKVKELKKQKKIIINLLLSFVLIFSSVSVVGCSDNEKAATDKKTETTQINDSNKQKENNNYEEVTVISHIDGDTVEVKHADGKTDKVRFIGINTPESTKEHEQYGKEASNFTKDKLLNKTVYLEKDVGNTDKYGRLLRYVWLNKAKEANEQEIKSKMINCILAEEGYAQQMTVQPNVKYADIFKKCVQEARAANKGLWSINPNGTTKGDKVTPAPTKNNTSNSDNSSGNDVKKQEATENIQPQVNASENNGAVVYSTKTGECYHSDGCSGLRKSKIQTTVQNAKSAGLRPCSKCHPPQ